MSGIEDLMIFPKCPNCGLTPMYWAIGGDYKAIGGPFFWLMSKAYLRLAISEYKEKFNMVVSFEKNGLEIYPFTHFQDKARYVYCGNCEEVLTLDDKPYATSIIIMTALNLMKAGLWVDKV